MLGASDKMDGPHQSYVRKHHDGIIDKIADDDPGKLASAAEVVPPGQHTRCAKCGLDKPTPYRRDDLGGYVCLTCVENYLNETIVRLEACEDKLKKVP
jgi:hypothetical protein